MLDRYFSRPLFWDYLIGLIGALLGYVFISRGYILPPKLDHLISTSSDLLTISLTFAGFVLTLLTILITFKGSAPKVDNNNLQDQPLFNIFFGTDYYFETVKHLKNAIKSLLFLSVGGYFIKLILTTKEPNILFLFCILGVVVIAFTLMRCVWILNQIIELQKRSS